MTFEATQAVEKRGIPRIGDTAPDFTAYTTQGQIKFSEWQSGKWVVFFAHPADFTPVCSTELAEFARRTGEFNELGARLIGVSIDSVHSHLAWKENLKKILDVNITYPLIADSDRKVASLYGLIHPNESETVTVRALFFIDPKRIIRAVIYYPLNVGRNVDEVKRVLSALQTTDKNSVATPVNWQPGDDVIVPPPKTEQDVEERISGNYEKKVDFYLNFKKL